MKEPRIGVGIIMFEDGYSKLPSYYKVNKRKVLLGLRKNSRGAGTWSVPGGAIEFGEHPFTTAQRELFEETGYQIEKRSFSIAFECPWVSDIIDGTEHWITLFVTALRPHPFQDALVKEPEKCERWEWFSLTRLPSPLFPPMKKFLEKMVKMP